MLASFEKYNSINQKKTTKKRKLESGESLYKFNPKKHTKKLELDDIAEIFCGFINPRGASYFLKTAYGNYELPDPDNYLVPFDGTLEDWETIVGAANKESGYKIIGQYCPKIKIPDIPFACESNFVKLTIKYPNCYKIIKDINSNKIKEHNLVILSEKLFNLLGNIHIPSEVCLFNFILYPKTNKYEPSGSILNPKTNLYELNDPNSVYNRLIFDEKYLEDIYNFCMKAYRKDNGIITEEAIIEKLIKMHFNNDISIIIMSYLFHQSITQILEN